RRVIANGVSWARPAVTDREVPFLDRYQTDWFLTGSGGQGLGDAEAAGKGAGARPAPRPSRSSSAAPAAWGAPGSPRCSARRRPGGAARGGSGGGRLRPARRSPVPVAVFGAGGLARAWISTVLGSAARRLVGVADVLDGAAARAVAEVGPAALRESVATGTDGVEVARRAGAEAVLDVTIPAAHHAVTAAALHAGYPALGEPPRAAAVGEAV